MADNNNTLRQTLNEIILKGRIAEIEIKEDKTKPNAKTGNTQGMYLSIRGAIQFDPKDKSKRVRFESFSKQFKDDGKTKNGLYEPQKSFAEQAKDKSLTKVPWEEALEVRITGEFIDNYYIKADGNVVEGIKTKATFYNVEAVDNYEAFATVEGYVQAKTPVKINKDEDSDERLRVRVIAVGYGGKIVPIDLFSTVEDKDNLEDFCQVGETVTFYMDFVNRIVKTAPAGGGWGKKRSQDKSYMERILTGGEDPLDEDNIKALNPEAIKNALQERKNAMDELKEKGYQGNSSSGNSVNRNNGFNAQQPAIDDDEVPF